MRETGHHIRHSAWGMTPGESRIDLQVAKPKTFSLVNELRARNWFPSWCKNICAGFLTQTRQVRDMIGVSVRKENELYIEFLAVRKADHFGGIGASIKSRGGTTRRVPDKIRVDCHIVVVGVELREAVSLINFLWMPFALGEFAKRSRGKAQHRCNAQKRQLIEIALAQCPDFLRTDTRFFCQFSIGDAQAALRFSNDVTDIVFERNHVQAPIGAGCL